MTLDLENPDQISIGGISEKPIEPNLELPQQEAGDIEAQWWVLLKQPMNELLLKFYN